MTDPAIPIESLLAHADWVRALAGRLVHDPTLADDVAQRTWLQALRRPPRQDSNLRGWLSHVVRNSARELGRGEGRRARREAAVARPEAIPATVDVVARANLQRELAGEVVLLDEPYRTTLLLHFFEGHAAGEVARRMGCPENTVRTRLRRGLGLLRERLDGRYGDRASWCALFLPLAPAPRVAAVAGASGGLGFLLLPALATLLAIGLGLRYLPALRSDAGPRPGALQLPTVIADGLPGVAPPEETRPAERTVAATSEPTPAAAPVPPPARAERRVGTVLAIGGDPVPGARVRWGDARTQADGSGRFELESDAPASALTLEEPGWTWVARGHLSGTTEDEVTLIAVPTRTVAGRVVGRDGRPVRGVHVTAAGLSHFDLLPRVLADAKKQASIAVETGADGRFSLADVPDVERLPLHANAPPLADTFGDPRLELPRGDVRDLEIRLDAEPAPNGVEGIVLDARGAPVPAAHVHFGRHEARTDARGRFTVGIEGTPQGMPLVAYLPGVGLGVRPDFSAELRRMEAPSPPAELVLSDGGNVLHGRVVDAAGRSVSGFRLVLVDGTPLGGSSEWLEDAYDDRRNGRTGADGRFRFGGLLDRAYRLRAWHADGRVVESGPVEPGDEAVELLVPEVAWRGPLRGRVVNRLGNPIAGIRVGVMVRTFDSDEAGLGPTERWTPEGRYAGSSQSRLTQSSGTDLACETDADGRFVLPRVPRGGAGVDLSFSGDRVRGESRSIPADLAPEHDFALTALHLVRLAQAGLIPGDVVSFLEPNGDPVTVHWSSTTTSTTAMNYRVTDAEAPILRVEETAVTAALYRHGEGEVARVALDLSAGEVWELGF